MQVLKVEIMWAWVQIEWPVHSARCGHKHFIVYFILQNKLVKSTFLVSGIFTKMYIQTMIQTVTPICVAVNEDAALVVPAESYFLI